jgi:hypothetical protein
MRLWLSLVLCALVAVSLAAFFACARQYSAPPMQAAYVLPGAYNPSFNTESYDRINDNPFLAARDNPLSTFSVRQSRAGRQALEGQETGSLPPELGDEAALANAAAAATRDQRGGLLPHQGCQIIKLFFASYKHAQSPCFALCEDAISMGTPSPRCRSRARCAPSFPGTTSTTRRFRARLLTGRPGTQSTRRHPSLGSTRLARWSNATEGLTLHKARAVGSTSAIFRSPGHDAKYLITATSSRRPPNTQGKTNAISGADPCRAQTSRCPPPLVIYSSGLGGSA